MKNENLFWEAETVLQGSYRKGFADGYDAAVFLVEGIVQEIKDGSRGFNLDAIMRGLETGAKSAYEVMGCPPAIRKIQTWQGPKRER